MGRILVIVEHHEGKLKNVSKEILSSSSFLAEKSGAKVLAVVYGSSVCNDIFEEIGQFGICEIYCGDNNLYLTPSNEILLPFLAEVINDCKPQLILTGNTSIGKDLLPPLAQLFSSDMVSDVIQINSVKDSIQLTKTIYGSRIIETTVFSNQRVFATIRPNTLEIAQNMVVVPSVKLIQGKISPPIDYILKEYHKKNLDRKPLYEADIIVCGGRGIKKAEDFVLLEALADVLGASLGYTRAVIDAGFKPRSLQIGQSGKTVSPKMIIACGISGAIQFVAGISNAQCIIAINKNPSATIFKTAHYGIVGDLYEIVPALTEEFKSALKR